MVESAVLHAVAPLQNCILHICMLCTSVLAPLLENVCHTILCFAALTSLPRVGTTLCIAHCKVSTKLTGLDLLQINKVADAEQQWVYIEASSERGTHLYLRNGFQIVKEAKMQPDAPTIYCMGRPPKPDVPSDV